MLYFICFIVFVYMNTRVMEHFELISFKRGFYKKPFICCVLFVLYFSLLVVVVNRIVGLVY